MSVDLKQLIDNLQSLKQKVDASLQRMKQASKNNNRGVYRQTEQIMNQDLSNYANLLDKASNVSQDVIDDYPDLKFEAKIETYKKFYFSIQQSIPPEPQSLGGEDFSSNGESQPLLNAEEEGKLRDQSALLYQMHQDNTQEINQIATKMNDINAGMQQMHSLVVTQQQTIDAIDQNVTLADENVEAGVREIDEAQKYQKKASKKLLWILIGCVAVVAILGGIVAVICVIKFA